MTLLPAATVVGTAVLVVTRSACVDNATTSVAVAVLFAGLGSDAEEVTVAVSLTAVPAAVPAVTFTVRIKVEDPVPKVLLLLQVMGPALPTVGVEHTHPLGGGRETNVVFGGVVSLKTAFVAVLGPGLVTTCV